MFGSYSPFWIALFIFQMLTCLFGMFSQFMFMKTTVWDKKITFYCRVYLFFLSIGYQLIIIMFLAPTFYCIWTAGSIFEVSECKETRMIPLWLHYFGEFIVVSCHLLVNIDRLMVSFQPEKTRGKSAKVYFYTSGFFTLALSVLYVDSLFYQSIRKTIALLAIFGAIVLNLLVGSEEQLNQPGEFQIELKLFHYTSVVYKNTIGLVPLERRLELSTSVTMIQCFLPASICGLTFKFIMFAFYYFFVSVKGPDDIAPFIFVLNFFWNLDCTVFPWFFILFNPSKRQKLKSLLRIGSPLVIRSQYQNIPASQMQQEHFDQLRNVWKVGV